MSFFDNTKILGWMMVILGILNILGAIVFIYEGVADTEGLGNNIGYAITGIGMLIAAVIYFMFGNSVRKGSKTGKLEIVSGFVRVIGVTSVIIGLFGAIGAVMNDDGVAGYVVRLILGLIVIFCASKMNDGKNTGFDKILWILLVLIFLIMVIASLLAIGGGIIGILVGIVGVVMYLFMLIYMFDPEVKNAML